MSSWPNYYNGEYHRRNYQRNDGANMFDDLYWVMFMHGYVWSYDGNKRSGVIVARYGNKYMLFCNDNVYINGTRLRCLRGSWKFLSPGTAVKVLFHEIDMPFQVDSALVKYQAVLVWSGDMPHVLTYSLFHPQILTPPENFLTAKKNYEVDVPLHHITEMSGNIYWSSGSNGVVSVYRRQEQATVYILFRIDVLYLHGKKVPASERLQILSSQMGQCNLYVKPIEPRRVFGVKVMYEALLMWCGKKPPLNLLYADSNSNAQVTDTESSDDCKEKSGIGTPSKCGTSQFRGNDGKPVSTVYLTGTMMAASDSVVLYGDLEKMAFFERSAFYLHGETLMKNISLSETLEDLKRNGPAALHSFIMQLEKERVVLGCRVRWKAILVWHGRVTPFLWEQIKQVNSSNFDLSFILRVDTKEEITKQQVNKHDKENPPNNNQLEVGVQKINDVKVQFPGRLTREKELRGSVLAADETEAIVTSFSDIIVFSKRKFYVNGKKFDKHESLVKFFEGELPLPAISALVIPVDTPRTVLGCTVSSCALVAWTGTQPEVLKSCKKDYFKNKQVVNASGNLKKEGNKPLEEGFAYFIGKFVSSSAGTGEGIIQCDRGGESIYASFTKNEIYRHGVKLPEEMSPYDSGFIMLLIKSRWSVLAREVPRYQVGNLWVDYQAVAMWHYQNQSELFDEFSQKLPIWSKRTCASDCRCKVGISPKKHSGLHVIGKIFTQDQASIVVEASHSKLGKQYIKLRTKHLWVDNCSCVFSSADTKRLCHVIVNGSAADGQLVHGVKIDMTASFAWIGVKPDHIMVPELSETTEYQHVDKLDMLDNFKENEVSTIGDDLDEEEDLVSLYVNDPEKFALKASAKVRATPAFDSRNISFGEIRGKHILGRLIRATEKFAVAEHCSQEFVGSIFIVCDSSALFIDTVPLSSLKAPSNLIYERSCNLYVIPLQADKRRCIDDVKISLKATVSWIGKKPLHIPSPGLQPESDLTLFEIPVFVGVKVQENGGKNRFKFHEVCSTKTAEAAATGVTGKKGATSHAVTKPDTSASAGRMSPPVSELSEILLPPISSSQGTNCDNLTLESCRPSGKITEIHEKIGRFQAADGARYYFNANQCYLFGVCLQDVELWHVLIQDQDIFYSLSSQQRMGSSVCEAVWVGCRTVMDREESHAAIKKWCADSCVPEGARDLMVHRLLMERQL